jgi:hypothetical protein
MRKVKTVRVEATITPDGSGVSLPVQLELEVVENGPDNYLVSKLSIISSVDDGKNYILRYVFGKETFSELIDIHLENVILL